MAKGCNQLQALYSATQTLRLETLAEARNEALNVGVGNGSDAVVFFGWLSGSGFSDDRLVASGGIGSEKGYLLLAARYLLF